MYLLLKLKNIYNNVISLDFIENLNTKKKFIRKNEFFIHYKYTLTDF